ncbi:oligosaccharide flippase family protein [Aquabacter sp. CN5-332]|uniref:oligosaccharide flippase family protein n=1 Tax=Aquabacter sp. CN5-332 TaxID=3156608 RepID=UPI0032B5E1C5
MVGVRQALLLTAAERYVVISVNFLMIAVLARLLTPEEFGFSVIGAATVALAECLRDFGVSGYIVQQRHLTRHGTQTAFCVMLLLSILVAAAVWFAAGPMASFYNKDGLRFYLEVTALSLLAGPFSGPPLALMRRDMDFAKVAMVNVASGVVTAAVTVGLAILGATYMSFAWGACAGALAAAILAVALRGELWIFRPSLADWRDTLSFGAYASATGFLSKIYEFVPSLLLGRILDFTAVGLYSRAALVCQLPDKCLLTGLLPIALPAMAAEVRAGRSLKPVYLHGITYITAVQWPALIVLAFLAQPIVLLLLGEQWGAITPLVRIMALGLLLSFPTVLAYPLLVAAGGVRDTMLGSLIVLVLGGSLMTAAAFFGLFAMAFGWVAAVALQAGVSLYFLRRHIVFNAGELAGALRKSAIVAAASSAVPALAVALNGFDFHLPIPVAIAVGAGAVLVWAISLKWTDHPLHAEAALLLLAIRRAAASARGMAARWSMRRRLRARGAD